MINDLLIIVDCNQLYGELKMDIRELEKKITECNEAYKNGERLIPDTEYDSLVEQLRTIDHENALVSKIQNDAPSTNGKKFSFGDRPMLSLNKVYSTEDLIKWMKSVSRDGNEEFLLQPKYDGLSGCIDRSGILSTRGDGHVGEIINSKIPMIKIDMWTKDYSGSLDSLTGHQNDFFFPCGGRIEQLRGEIIVRKDVFEKLKKSIKKKDGQEYKNSRNCVSGLMNPASSEKDDAEIARRLKENNIFVSFVDHDAISEVVKLNDENLTEKIEKTWSYYREHLPYDQDGLVVKLMDRWYAAALGNTEHHPRGACALKRNNIESWSRLTDIKWTVGMNGELTPTAVIEPIEIDGVTVEHVLLHNLQQIIDRNLRIGCEISVERSGNVIPKWINNSKADSNGYQNLGFDHKEFEENFDKLYQYLFIDDCKKFLVCPCCGSPIIFSYGDSPDCYCSNPDCHDRAMKRLYNAVSKCFDIKGLAEETLEKISEKYHIKKFYQLLDLEISDIRNLEGFAQKSAEILYESIQKARFCTDVQILSSLGIRLIGRSVAKDILSIMTLDSLRHADIESLVKIKGFGREKAESLTKGLSDCSDELDELLSRVEYKNTFSMTKKAISEGVPTICFTGEAPLPRSKCQEIAKKNGYEPVNGVNKNLAVLVCASTDTHSSKAEKARRYGTKIIGFDEWFNSLEDKEVDFVEKTNHGNSTIDSIIDQL